VTAKGVVGVLGVASLPWRLQAAADGEVSLLLDFHRYW